MPGEAVGDGVAGEVGGGHAFIVDQLISRVVRRQFNGKHSLVSSNSAPHIFHCESGSGQDVANAESSCGVAVIPTLYCTRSITSVPSNSVTIIAPLTCR